MGVYIELNDGTIKWYNTVRKHGDSSERIGDGRDSYSTKCGEKGYWPDEVNCSHIPCALAATQPGTSEPVRAIYLIALIIVFFIPVPTQLTNIKLLIFIGIVLMAIMTPDKQTQEARAELREFVSKGTINGIPGRQVYRTKFVSNDHTEPWHGTAFGKGYGLRDSTIKGVRARQLYRQKVASDDESRRAKVRRQAFENENRQESKFVSAFDSTYVGATRRGSAVVSSMRPEFFSLRLDDGKVLRYESECMLDAADGQRLECALLAALKRYQRTGSGEEYWQLLGFKDTGKIRGQFAKQVK